MKIFLSKKNSWSNKLFDRLKNKDVEFIHYDLVSTLKRHLEKNDLSAKVSHIFSFHCSDYIPPEIFTKYKCISFHTANLPNGRGGNPIQNQILDKISTTFVNAIETVAKMDEGGIYTRREISLQGSLEDIWHTIADKSYDMIFEILEKDLSPRPQILFGQPAKKYKRVKGNDLPFELLFDIETVYDYIRMRDAEGYDKSQIKLGNFILEFSRAKYEKDTVFADVKIRKYDGK